MKMNWPTFFWVPPTRECGDPQNRISLPGALTALVLMFFDSRWCHGVGVINLLNTSLQTVETKLRLLYKFQEAKRGLAALCTQWESGDAGKQ